MNLKRYIDAMIRKSIRRYTDWNPAAVRNELSKLFAYARSFLESGGIFDHEVKKICGRIAKFSKEAIDILDSKSPSVTKFSSRGQTGPARWKTGAVWSHEAGPGDIKPIIDTMSAIVESNIAKFDKYSVVYEIFHNAITRIQNNM